MDDADELWFCYWPFTFLEAFLFVNASTNNNAALSPEAISPAASIAPSATGYMAPESYKGGPPPPGESEDMDEDDYGHHGPRLGLLLGKRHDEPSPVPRKFKMEERRLQSSNNNAHCVKKNYQDSAWTSVLDGNGQKIVISLPETELDNSSVYRARRRAKAEAFDLDRRDSSEVACYCQWNNWQ